MKRPFLPTLLLLGAAPLAAQEATTTQPVSRIEIQPAAVEVTIGDTARLTATAYGPEGEAVDVLESPGRPLGLFAEGRHGRWERPLGSGGALLIFTDGVLELGVSGGLAQKKRWLCAVAAQARHLAVRQRGEIGAGKAHPLRRTLAAARQQVHHRERGDRLAAAGFADQAMGLALLDPE